MLKQNNTAVDAFLWGVQEPFRQRHKNGGLFLTNLTNYKDVVYCVHKMDAGLFYINSQSQ